MLKSRKPAFILKTFKITVLTIGIWQLGLLPIHAQETANDKTSQESDPIWPSQPNRPLWADIESPKVTALMTEFDQTIQT